jgi:tetratricopeptide (TPR) repeat protein
VADPSKSGVLLHANLAESYFQEAQRLLASGRERPAAAALSLHRALLLVPGHARARSLSRQICTEAFLHFGDSQILESRELERSAATSPENAELWLRLAQLHVAEGNPLRAVVAFKRYLRLRPEDAVVAEQLAQLTGESAQGRAPASKAGEIVHDLVTHEIGIPAVGATDWAASGPVASAPATTTPSREPATPARVLARKRAAAPPPEEFWSGPGRILAVLFATVTLGSVVYYWLTAPPVFTSHRGPATTDLEGKEPRVREDLQALLRGGKAAPSRASRGRPETLGTSSGPAVEDPPVPRAATSGGAEQAEEILRRGQDHYRQRRYEEALGAFDAVIEGDPRSELAIEATLWRAMTQAASGDPLAAARDYRAVLERTQRGDPLHRRATEGIAELFASFKAAPRPQGSDAGSGAGRGR